MTILLIIPCLFRNKCKSELKEHSKRIDSTIGKNKDRRSSKSKGWKKKTQKKKSWPSAHKQQGLITNPHAPMINSYETKMHTCKKGARSSSNWKSRSNKESKVIDQFCIILPPKSKKVISQSITDSILKDNLCLLNASRRSSSWRRQRTLKESYHQ